MPGKKDYRQGVARLRQRFLRLEPIEVGHMEIEHDAAGGLAAPRRQQLARRRIGLCGQPGRAHQPREALSDHLVVIDDEHYRIGTGPHLRHRRSSRAGSGACFVHQ